MLIKVMKKQIIKIQKIPHNIKKKIIWYLYKPVFLAGYKEISTKYKTPIIELPDKKRIWVLKYEIKYKKR
uniref:Cytochrome b6-f complex subunit PetP n=1 Tax=Laurencia obtusa TaxID=137763 RepID=UPI0028D576BE|nr:Cytochrome b6-f complex subunit PetP [Laurencia obtusa]WMP12935.1 Cytochrome b6-f complex subunit PetP [Laurencia obtusa]